MVGKGHWGDEPAMGLQVDDHLLGRRNTGQEEHLRALVEVLPVHPRRLEQGLQFIIVECGEEKLLVGIEGDRLREDAEFHRLQVFRAFRDDDNIGPGLSLCRLAEPSCGKQLVIDDQAVIVDQQDVDARLDITMLESIIEQDDVHILCLLIMCEPFDATRPFPVDSHIETFELPLHLVRLIADLRHRGMVRGEHIPMAFPLVPS